MMELKKLRHILEIEENKENYRALINLREIQDELKEIDSSNKSKCSVNDAAWERIKMNHRKAYGNEGEEGLYRQSHAEIWGSIFWAMKKSWIIILVTLLL
jgi:hypothetical protein